jgi:broad specificity phosphatase PhoE
MPTAAHAASVIFLTHPQVIMNPAIPVPAWPLSGLGRERLARFAGCSLLDRVTAIYSSGERKAVDSAEILSDRLGVPFTIAAELHENDRSATGYLPPEQFEAVADRFFAEPDTRVLGWERATDAQCRIVACVHGILERETTAGDIVIAAHGAVGALLLAHLSGMPISRRFDQPGSGGGNFFAWRRAPSALLHGWRSIDRLEQGSGGASAIDTGK